MISVILALIFFTLCILIFLVLEVTEVLRDIKAQGDYEVADGELEGNNVISDGEFENRISRMIAEVNYGAASIKNHVPTVSEVLEDGIYNIPHNEVNTYETFSEEVSE